MIVTLSFKIISGVGQRASNPLIWVRCWWARGAKAGEKLNAIWCRWAPQPTEEPPHYSTRRSSDEIREGRHSSCGGPLTWFPRDFAASGYEGLERCERAPSPTEKEPAGDGDDQINHEESIQIRTPLFNRMRKMRRTSQSPTLPPYVGHTHSVSAFE